MASSSALQLGDIALTWSNVTGGADLSKIDDDVASDCELTTAVELSLFTDRRAEDDEVPPSGDENDRRGWWADEFADVQGDKYGSKLWLLDRSKRQNETVLRAKEYAREGLAWMIEDRVAESIDVTVEASDLGLLLGITIHRAGRDPISLRFASRWDNLQEVA